MNRKTRIIQISGLRGLLMAIFVVTCLIAGFVAFPAIVAMHIWNYVANFVAIPTINTLQGLMLWSIVAISGFIINDKKKFLVAFKSPNELSEKEMEKVMERIKMQAKARALNSMLLKSQEIKSLEKEEKQEEESGEKKI